MSRLLALLVVVCMAVAVTAADMHYSTGESETQYLNALHHPESIHHARQLEAVFLELDANADGEVDANEMQALQHEGRLSAAEHTLMQAFDSDASGAVSMAEFTMAPHTLNLLETSAEVGMPNFQSSEERMAEGAFEGRSQPAPRRFKMRRAPTDAVLSELAAHMQIPDTSTYVKGASKRTAGASLPVSLFGVPSVADEECVICQYFVQRIQNGVADRLQNAPDAAADPSSSSAGAAGLPGATAAAQKALQVRNTNSQLQKKPGGRGVVRVVAEDVISGLCAVDKMPLLFNPYCSGISEPNAINAVRKGIFFNIPTVEVCSQAALCRDDSYLNTNAAVHATKTSLFLNGQRGICGMLGGSKDRKDSREGLVLNAICAAHGAVFGEGA